MRKRTGNASPTSKETRFKIAGRALAAARSRNRKVESGGSGCPILVEGRKDIQALRQLGFSGPIELVNRGWDRSRLVAYLFETYGSRNPVDGAAALIVLMDWDRTGGRLQNELGIRLKSMDIKIDEETRMHLVRSLKPEGKTIEGLAPHASDLLWFIDEFDPLDDESE